METTQEPKKYVQQYQATDEEGNPIGRPTHLEADTPEEMFQKYQEAHVAASRALARQNKAFNDLKSRKLQPIAPPAAPRMTAEQEANYAAVVGNPGAAPSQKKEAIREIGGITELEKRLDAAEAKAQFADGERVAIAFMRNHLRDYYPCDANKKVMSDFLKENNLEFTLDNLEIAFVNVQSQLADDPRLQNNPTPIAEPTAPRQAQQSQPGFGIQPGSGSGNRPVAQAGNGKMNRKDVLAKKKADPAWWKKVLQDPALEAEVNAALARS